MSDSGAVYIETIKIEYESSGPIKTSITFDMGVRLRPMIYQCAQNCTTYDLKSYGRWNLPRAFVFSFDCLEILNAESNIRVKSYDFLNFSCASVIHFRVFRYIMGVNHTIESKVMAVWIFREHSCLILRISIYYELELDIWVKSSMTFWISR